MQAHDIQPLKQVVEQQEEKKEQLQHKHHLIKQKLQQHQEQIQELHLHYEQRKQEIEQQLAYEPDQQHRIQPPLFQQYQELNAILAQVPPLEAQILKRYDEIKYILQKFEHLQAHINLLKILIQKKLNN